MNAPHRPSRFDWHHVRLLACAIASATLLGIAWQRAGDRLSPVQVHADPTLAALSPQAATPVAARLQAAGPAPAPVAPPHGIVDARIDRFRPAPAASGHGPVIPPEQRWRIEFAAGLTIVPYAAQLDAVGIELAVVGPQDDIVYVTGLSRETPKIRHGKRAQENRFYFTWGRGDLEELDRVLLANAGVDVGQGVIVHFLTPEAERTMLDFEKKFKKQPLERVAQTVFRIRKTFRGYEIYVDRQTFRSE